MPKFSMLRKNLPEDDCLCNHCTALCCRYFSLPIKSPKTWEDFEAIHWYLSHGKVALFVEDRTWYLVVFGACRYLTPDNRCGIYTSRPAICGQYTTEGCEYDNDFVFDQYFETPAQILEYAEAILPPQTPEPRNLPRTVMLQVDAPESWDDYDNFRWYMTHGRIAMFVQKGKWHLIVYADDESMTRELFDSFPSWTSSSKKPAASRKRQPVKAELPEGPVQFGKYFETPEQIWEYAEAVLPPREPLLRDLPQTIDLPVLNAV